MTEYTRKRITARQELIRWMGETVYDRRCIFFGYALEDQIRSRSLTKVCKKPITLDAIHFN